MMSAVRVLHVVGGMNRGGTETWLMHVLRHIDRQRIHLDFLVHSTTQAAYDAEIESLGSAIIPCPGHTRPLTYARNFRRILQQHGPYDIVHSHVHDYSGYVLHLADRAGVPVRIAHSHSDTTVVKAASGPIRRIYLRLMRHWIARHATLGLAASRQAADALFGGDWQNWGDHRIMHCGIDLSPFQEPVDRGTIRAELGIPDDAFVIGHVGRFVDVKNHTLLIRLAAEVARQDAAMRLLLVGDGPLRPVIEQQVNEQGLSERVVFTGVRPDVPRLMRGAMDLFVLPSLYEGLGLVLIEAQAAGLPCIASDVIPEEADIVTPLVHRVALTQPLSAWTQAILKARDTGPGITQPDALQIIKRSPFNICASVNALTDLYCHAPNKGG